MSRISDDMRCRADKCDANYRDGYSIDYQTVAEWLRDFADRIDAEMVELPKDKSGEPVHPGDALYSDDGDRTVVGEMRYTGPVDDFDGWSVYSESDMLLTEWFTHDPDDSLERIAQDMENRASSPLIQCGAMFSAESVKDDLLEFAERIRKQLEDGKAAIHV